MNNLIHFALKFSAYAGLYAKCNTCIRNSIATVPQPCNMHMLLCIHAAGDTFTDMYITSCMQMFTSKSCNFMALHNVFIPQG